MSAAELVVTGAGASSDPGLDPRKLLREPKMRKFMGAQDRLALAAARAAAQRAGLGEGDLGPAVGLFLTVGWLPFEREDIDELCAESCREGRFDLAAFFARSYESINPLLTFRCLSNMPAYHSSANLGIQGPYVTSYAGVGQLYVALEEAQDALAPDAAQPLQRVLWGGVAYQRNFLVEHHLGRIPRPEPARPVGDGAGVLVLEPAAAAEARGARPLARLVEWSCGYEPRDPREPGQAREELTPSSEEDLDRGVASLPWALATRIAAGARGELSHRAETHDGYLLASRWELL